MRHCSSLRPRRLHLLFAGTMGTMAAAMNFKRDSGPTGGVVYPKVRVDLARAVPLSR